MRPYFWNPRSAIVFLFALLVLGGCTSPVDAAHKGIPYAQRLETIKSFRDSLSTKYLDQAASAQGKTLSVARKYVLRGFEEEIIPAWIGTEWDFSGTTTVPGEGKIACGYFITTVLRDLGFNLERARMAQQASLYIIKSLIGPGTRQDWSYITPEVFAQRVAALPLGLYVVGLDIHTGFVLNKEDGVWFIHSSYMDPVAVVKENASKSKALAASKRFVLGRVDNDWLLDKWLRKSKVETLVP